MSLMEKTEFPFFDFLIFRYSRMAQDWGGDRRNRRSCWTANRVHKYILALFQSGFWQIISPCLCATFRNQKLYLIKKKKKKNAQMQRKWHWLSVGESWNEVLMKFYVLMCSAYGCCSCRSILPPDTEFSGADREKMMRQLDNLFIICFPSVVSGGDVDLICSLENRPLPWSKKP